MVENEIKAACAYVTAVNLFDVYEGIQLPPSKKSMAFSVVFTPKDAELTDADMEGHVNAILAALENRYGITLRV